MRRTEQHQRQPSTAQPPRVPPGARRQHGGDSSAAGRGSYFVAAFEAAREAMVILDDGRYFVEANPAACELLGVGADTLIGRRLDEFAGPLTREGLDDDWTALLRKGYGRGKHELLRGDGSLVAIEATTTARVAPGHHLSIIRDITESNATDALLEHQRRQLIEAQSVGGFGSWEWDLVSGAIEWSDEMYRIYGLEPGSASHLADIRPLRHPDDRARSDEVIARARVNHEPFVHEFRIVRPDGTIRVIESRGQVALGEDGMPARMFGTGQDITARKQAEAERQNISTVLDGSDDAISTCSLDGVLLSWNRGAEKLYGYTAQEAIGQHVSMLLPAEERGADQANWKRTLNGEHVGPFESVRITKDGRNVVVAVTLSTIIDASAEIIGLAAIGRDVTEHRRTLEALAETHAKALEASKSKSQFMANMNHELRTPLNGVIGISSLLLGTPLNDEQREYVEALRVSGDALMAVIEDILDFSKIEAGKLDLENAPFELRTVVEDVCSMVAVGQPNRAVEVIASVDSEVPVGVWGDANRVRQVLTNLTNNAVKFTEVGEVAVHVRGRRESTNQVNLHFEVVDTGIGIDARAQESIFESFAQVDGSNTRRYGGTGLGLTIAKQLVMLMGGEIGVRSAPGEGSTFWFTLPLRVADAASPPNAHPALRGLRVLVVDDKATNRGILERQLGDWGMKVHTAAGGEAGLAALQAAARSAHPYDLALLDYKMPGMSGGEVALAIKADPTLGSTTLVMMVAARDTRSASTVVELDGVVTKPLRQARLHDEIAHAIGATPARSPEADRDESADRAAAAAALRVLVAEDNVVNQLVAVRLLQRRGYQVDVAADGREALEMHERAPYDAIFMDCQMPELDGYETTREIRRREGSERHTPIIAMTASTMPGDTERCLAAGMDFYSGKPISPAGLDYVLAQAFGSPAGAASHSQAR
jgi:two-component system sensor histidine kinase/response regulator